MNNEMPKMNNKEETNIIEESKKMVKKDAKDLKTFFKDTREYLATKNNKELQDLAIRLALIVIIILLLYVPFQLIRDLGINILISVGINFSNKTLDMYNSVFNVLYSLFGIALFYAICKDRFYKLVKKQEENKEKQN